MPFRPTNKSKTPPPEETFEEAAYLKALGEKQKLVTIKLQGGEVVHGWIEYYDRDMLRLTREGAPNLFIFKSEILYIEEGDGKPLRPRRKNAPLKPEASSDVE
jgi:host factor-I protein